jgi:mannose-6-phosphate isomerase-like protein (cupin superfamily)
MKLSVFLLTALLLCATSAKPQADGTIPVSIEKEPHHSVTFENDRVRVFHLQLQPNEATKTHRHPSFYAYFSLRPATISNEVTGHAPVITQLEQGELRTSKGGFNVAERNESNEPADVFVVQPVKSAGNEFATPLAIRVHDAGIGELYTGLAMHVYSLAIASGGQLEERTEAYDSLVIALTDSNIREIVPGKASADWNMKAGETRWIPRGTTHSETNSGSIPAALIVFEFN